MRYEIKAEQLDKTIAKQKELIKLLLRNYTSARFPMNKITYIARVKKLRKELAVLEQEKKEVRKPTCLLNYDYDSCLKPNLNLDACNICKKTKITTKDLKDIDEANDERK